MVQSQKQNDWIGIKSYLAHPNNGGVEMRDDSATQAVNEIKKV